MLSNRTPKLVLPSMLHCWSMEWMFPGNEQVNHWFIGYGIQSILLKYIYNIYIYILVDVLMKSCSLFSAVIYYNTTCIWRPLLFGLLGCLYRQIVARSKLMHSATCMYCIPATTHSRIFWLPIHWSLLLHSMNTK